MTSLDQILFNPEVEDNARTAKAIESAKSTPIGELRRENARMRRQIDALESRDQSLLEKIETLSKQLADQAAVLTTMQRLVRQILTNRPAKFVNKVDLSKVVADIVLDEDYQIELNPLDLAKTIKFASKSARQNIRTALPNKWR